MSLMVSIFAHHDDDPQIEATLSHYFSGQFGSEFPILTPAGHTIVYRTYLNDRSTAETIKTEAQACLSTFKNIHINIETLNDVDWQTAWQAHFTPYSIGTHLYITVPWDTTCVPHDRQAIIIDPGMAFGTGGHPTTEGCLFFLDKLVTPNMSVIDWGTGSAILAIAAAKLGATVIAFDNDPKALEPARSNIELNQVKTQIQLFTSDGSDLSQPVDLIVANITADIHIRLISQYRKLSNTWILSGISDFRKGQMDLFLGIEGLTPSEVWEKDGWYTYLIT